MRVVQSSSNQVQGTEGTQGATGAKRVSSKDKDAKKSGKAGGSAPLADAARPEISDRARDLSKAKAAATEAPDVREEKIAELKRRIAGGKYGVDSHAIADHMVDEHLEMSGLG
jgi:negative regulator of flagellin synthesis FlgM